MIMIPSEEHNSRYATTICLRLVAITLITFLSGCTQSTRPVQPESKPVQASPPIGAFEIDGILGRKEMVLVKPMIEADSSVKVRAIQAGVDASSLRAMAYGIELHVVYRDVEMGAAFAHRIHIYHLRTPNNQIIADEAYYYCNGFLSPDIARVSEKSWSKYYSANGAIISQLDTLAEAVRNGDGSMPLASIQDAYKVFGSGLGFLRDGGPEQNRFEHEVAWFSGKESIDGVCVDLTRSKKFGNRVGAEFCQ
jgi:hypothetical protein